MSESEGGRVDYIVQEPGNIFPGEEVHIFEVVKMCEAKY